MHSNHDIYQLQQHVIMFGFKDHEVFSVLFPSVQEIPFVTKFHLPSTFAYSVVIQDFSS